MNILYLGNKNKRIIDFLNKDHHTVFFRQNRILNNEKLDNIDYIISYGYRFLIPIEIVNCFKNRAINLHISFLPWNRGADPNLWSFLEDTPKGVTIHYIDCKLDTGAILGQTQIEYTENDTLQTTYDKLTKKMEELFLELWNEIKNNNIVPMKPITIGSYHCLKDKEKYLFLLQDGWKTKVIGIIGKAKVGDLYGKKVGN